MRRWGRRSSRWWRSGYCCPVRAQNLQSQAHSGIVREHRPSGRLGSGRCPLAVNIWQLSHVGYGISSGAYASCFFAMQIVMTIQVVVLALWVLSLANRAGYESKHPIAMPAPDAALEVATPISALARSYEMFALFLGTVVLLAWVVCYFL